MLRALQFKLGCHPIGVTGDDKVLIPDVTRLQSLHLIAGIPILEHLESFSEIVNVVDPLDVIVRVLPLIEFLL